MLGLKIMRKELPTSGEIVLVGCGHGVLDVHGVIMPTGFMTLQVLVMTII